MSADFLANEIDVNLISPDADQPRRKMHNLQQLAASITAAGVVQPIIVRPHPAEPGRYMIICGERRWRAAVIAGMTRIPVFNKADISSERIFFTQLVENLEDYRDPLEAHEKAVALQKYVDSVGVDVACSELGQKKDWISRETALAKVPDEIWDLADREQIKDKRTILDLHRLCKHSQKPPEDEWQAIKEMGPKRREALHSRMESSGAKKKRKAKDEAVAGAEDSGDVSPGAGSEGQIDQVALRPASLPQGTGGGSGSWAPPAGAAVQFRRKGLNARVRKASTVLGIDADRDFEAFLDVLLAKAVPEVEKVEG